VQLTGCCFPFFVVPFNPLSQVLLNYRRWRVDQYTQIIKSITPETLSAFLPRLFNRLFLEALVVGNIPAQEAADIVTAAHQKMRAAWGAADVWSG
jgi:secreted Zn-dependent insulinase-like peptidase